jgi:hypothetical protein
VIKLFLFFCRDDDRRPTPAVYRPVCLDTYYHDVVIKLFWFFLSRCWSTSDTSGIPTGLSWYILSWRRDKIIFIFFVEMMIDVRHQRYTDRCVLIYIIMTSR